MGLSTNLRSYVGWLGVVAGSEEEAAWLLRAMVVEAVLVRREGSALFLPIGASPKTGQADRVIQVFRKAWRLLNASRRAGAPG
jgi:hypothetical protein